MSLTWVCDPTRDPARLPGPDLVIELASLLICLRMEYWLSLLYWVNMYVYLIYSLSSKIFFSPPPGLCFTLARLPILLATLNSSFSLWIWNIWSSSLIPTPILEDRYLPWRFLPLPCVWGSWWSWSYSPHSTPASCSQSSCLRLPAGRHNK